MISEVTADLWTYSGTRVIVVPSNCLGVCGRGIAKQAADRYCGLQTQYKNYLAALPNQDARSLPVRMPKHPSVLMFPVKYDWKDKADLGLIEQNLTLLPTFGTVFALPELGCGFGERSWKDEVGPIVRRVCEPMGVNVLVVHPAPSLKATYPASFRPGARRDGRFS